MNTRRALRSVVLLSACATLLMAYVAPRALGEPEKSDPKLEPEFKRLQGKWEVIQVERDGKIVSKAPDEDCKGLCVIISDRTYNANFRGVSQTVGEITLELDKTPKTLTVVTKEESLVNGRTMLAIYALDGDSLTICGTSVGGARPKEFVTKQGSPDILLKLKRVKAQ